MKQPTFYFAIVSIVFIGCGPIGPSTISLDRQQQNPYYVSPPSNPPLLKHKGDMLASIITSTGDKRVGVDFGLAYKPTTHFGLLGNFSIHNGSLSQDGDWFSGQWLYTRTEFGAGYTHAIGKAWMAECYTGGGFGNTTNDHGSGHSKLNQGYFFIQPAMGYHSPKGNTEFGMVMRLNRMHIKIDEAGFDPSQESYTASQFILMQSTPDQWLLEPGVICRFGWPMCMFQLGVNYAVNLTESELQSKNFAAALGVVFKFNTAKK